jgi:diacylglycerol kinase
MSRIHPDQLGGSAARQTDKKQILSRPPLFRWIIRRGQSFGHAFRGLLVLFLAELHFRIHLGAAALAIGLGFFFEISTVEWLILILTISGVLVAEAINSALERLVDLVRPERHPLARDVKDLAAGAVLLASIGAGLIGTIIFLPPLYRFLCGL